MARLTKQSKKYIMHRTQSGFRQNKSTTDNCTVLKEIYKNTKRKKKGVHAIYIDISKVFDSIQHWHIEEVLKYYKINPKLTVQLSVVDLFCLNPDCVLCIIYFLLCFVSLTVIKLE